MEQSNAAETSPVAAPDSPDTQPAE
jgi:hypothetical protein